jgi:hypothetical protein
MKVGSLVVHCGGQPAVGAVIQVTILKSGERERNLLPSPLAGICKRPTVSSAAWTSPELVAADHGIWRSAFPGRAARMARNLAGSADPVMRARAALIAAKSALDHQAGLPATPSIALAWAVTAAELRVIERPTSSALSKAAAIIFGFVANARQCTCRSMECCPIQSSYDRVCLTTDLSCGNAE